MIRATWQYIHDEALPRIGSIMKGSELWISVLAGTLLGHFADDVISGVKPVDTVAGALLTYAAIAFGFCLAGLTLALTLPDNSFARRLATARKKRESANAYSDLLFVFSWTALCHWILILSLLALLAVCEPALTIMPSHAAWPHRAVVSIMAALSLYGILQFLITLITLSQLGRTYIEFLSRDDSRDPN